jgi:hypothetical protein
MLSKTILVFVILMFSWQSETTAIEFLCFGKYYEFDLPGSPDNKTEFRYTEGIFRTYLYKTGETVLLHAGGNQLKPLLRGRKYKVTDSSSGDFITSRKGYDRETGLYWHEITTLSEEVTLYYKGVKQEDRKRWEECLQSLRVTRVIK